MKRLPESFYARSADIVAKELLGKVLIKKVNNTLYEAIIVETESYFDHKDPASRATKRNKISEMMWEKPGTIMIYNVHKYLMFNIVTGKKDDPQAVLIRALEPINFEGRCSGPGLLSNTLNINRTLHGKKITSTNEITIIDGKKPKNISKSHRIGVTKDLEEHFRFYITDNKFVS